MLKTRLIPCLLLQNGTLVRSERFSVHQVIGYPLQQVSRFSEWAVDELIYLDITRNEDYDLRRDDHKLKNLEGPLEILDAVARSCFIPLNFGGRISTVDDVRTRIQRGADKVTLNSAAFRTPAVVAESAAIFGSQAIVVCIDVRRDETGKPEVWIDGGATPTGLDPAAWARDLEELGAGEVLLQSIDRDGTGEGYDLELIGEVAESTALPVVALGGVGTYEQFAPAVKAGASAVAAANIFHFKELSDRNAKRAMARSGLHVRL